jgi:hypothetical protein
MEPSLRSRRETSLVLQLFGDFVAREGYEEPNQMLRRGTGFSL